MISQDENEVKYIVTRKGIWQQAKLELDAVMEMNWADRESASPIRKAQSKQCLDE